MQNTDATTKKNARRTPTAKERLKSLLDKERKAVSSVEAARKALEKSKKNLSEIQREISKVQIEAVGLEFLSINPDEFVEISDSLERLKIPPGRILKLLAEGNFTKMQEIYLAMKSVGITKDVFEGDDNNDA